MSIVGNGEGEGEGMVRGEGWRWFRSGRGSVGGLG